MAERFQYGLREEIINKGNIAKGIVVSAGIAGTELAAKHLGAIGEQNLINGAELIVGFVASYYLGSVLIIPKVPEIYRKMLQKVHKGERI